MGDLLIVALINEAERLGCGNCYRAFFLSTRPVARSAENTAFARSACTRNTRASMVGGLTS